MTRRFDGELGIAILRLHGPYHCRRCDGIVTEHTCPHAGTDAAHVYGGLMATLTAWAELRGVPYAGVPVGTIKRHVTGKGRNAHGLRGSNRCD